MFGSAENAGEYLNTKKIIHGITTAHNVAEE